MSNFEYTSFNSAKLSEIIGDQDLTEELWGKYLMAINDPDLNDYLRHQREQFIQALEAEAVDDRWQELWDFTNEAEAALEGGNPSSIARAFFKLGESTQRLQQLRPGEILELCSATLGKMQRERPLIERNSQIRFLKDYAKLIAGRLWSEDSEKQVRISDACAQVWPELVDVGLQHLGKELTEQLLPNDAGSLRPWLRPVAPEYAKKGGRPKNSKK